MCLTLNYDFGIGSMKILIEKDNKMDLNLQGFWIGFLRGISNCRHFGYYQPFSRTFLPYFHPDWAFKHFFIDPSTPFPFTLVVERLY